MNRSAKIVLYAALALAAGVSLYFFLREYHAIRQPPAEATGLHQFPETHMMVWFGVMVVTIVSFGLLVAYDVTHYLGSKAEQYVFSDGGEGVHIPEYEEAENLWANGQHLEAIAHLREFLKKEPRQMYAALRIAEIYEKDLNNPLAAALEYEEILQKKLPPERWGWAAIHLANLYSGPLSKTDEALQLLKRITEEHPQTAAAKKARERLGLPEPEAETPELLESPLSAQTETAAEESPSSNLPPGFRPK